MKEFPESENTRNRKQGLLSGQEQPHNAFEHQLILAEELYRRDHLSAVMEAESSQFRNEAMRYWIEKEYAAGIRRLIEHPEFKNHSRLKNDPLAFMLSDVEYFLHNKELPER